MNRRRFVQSTALAGLAAATSRAWAGVPADSPYMKNIGIQLYTLRNPIGQDLPGTIAAVVEAGYKQAELYGFPDNAPMIAACKEAGLELHSTHFNWDSAVNPSDQDFTDFRRILEQAGEAGFSHLVVPYLHGGDRDSLDAYRRTAANLNRAAELAKQADITLSYHNHSFEFQPMDDGKSGFDVFIEEFNEAMKFELDVFWVEVGGVDTLELMDRLDGRVTQLHLKDLAAGLDLPVYGGVPQESFKELGNGVIPMAPIMAKAAEIGVEHCHVEQDHSPDPVDSIRQSMAHLRG